MIRSDIRSLHAYHVPDSTGMLKLDAMENPYPLPDSLRSEWAGVLSESDINRYPDADMLPLRRRIAGREGVQPDQVLIGNGSDEIIQMLLMATDTGPCAVPKPTFVMYEAVAKWLKRPVASIPLKPDFSLDAKAFLHMCAREKASIAFLACPNNPTGNLWPREDVQQIADNYRGLLVIDEAYGPFAKESYRDMITRNVLLLRTFSKLGMAGLRLGYALGDATLIAELNKVRLPYNVNTLTQISVAFFLDHFEVFEEQTKRICLERECLLAAMQGMDKLEVFPSQTNFLLFRVDDPGNVFEGLKKAGILIKNLHAKGSLLEGCLRVTIGRPEENNRFASALKELL